MKAKVILPVSEAHTYTWEGKKYCPVVVEFQGVKFDLIALEGSDNWALKIGDEVEVEISKPAENGRNARVKRPKPVGGKFGTYERRKFTRPTKEEAGAAADYITDLFHAIKGRIKEADDMTIAALTVATYNKTC